MRYLRSTLRFVSFLGAVLVATPATAAEYRYVDWKEANVGAGTAEGTITLPDGSEVIVEFAAIDEDGSPGTLYGAQIDGGTNYWTPSEPFVSDEVENSPPTPDILQLSGGLDQTYRVLLSEAIKDPIMAIVSLGQAAVRTTYDFDSPFTIVSQGAGYWGGGDAALTALDGDILEGYEGHGTIRFEGTFETFSWTVPTPESWHGFTFAIRTTLALEPEDGAGGEGGAAASGGAAGESQGGAPAASGGSTASGGTTADGGTTATSGGTRAEGGDSSTGGDGAEERPSRGDDEGCGCTLPGQERTSLSGPLAVAALVLALTARSKRRRTRH